ncbi:MAG: hypothetical protein KA371_11560 [Acidobacteria bacterium]|nr:hypothetical protein [Acidobacteriota bacterium]
MRSIVHRRVEVASFLLLRIPMRTIAGVSGRAVWVGIALALTLARPAAAGALAISWADYSVDEDGFLVERRAAAGGGFQQIAVQGRNAVAYLDNAVPAGGAYCYRVRAFNVAGVSAYTDEGCGTATATSSPLTVTLNGTSYRQTETMVATVHASAGFAVPVDAYVVVQTAGVMLSLQLDGRLVPGLVPIARNILLPTIDAPFSFPLAGAPPGTYTWIAGVTSPGTLTMLASVASTTFTITQ